MVPRLATSKVPPADLEIRLGVRAHELDDAARRELMANLEKLTGKNVKLAFQIDKDIIGGVVTRVGSTVYDSSVRTKLKNLREQLVGA